MCLSYYSHAPPLFSFSVTTERVFISEERLMEAPEGYREERGNRVATIGWSPCASCVSKVLWLHVPTCQSLPAMHYLRPELYIIFIFIHLVYNTGYVVCSKYAVSI